jgi:hypothetical protein
MSIQRLFTVSNENLVFGQSTFLEELADDISHCLSSINPLNLVQVFLEK